MGSSEKTASMRTLIALSLAISAIAAQAPQAPLPNYMLGDFQLETSEGFSDYMYEIGVNWFTRTIACTLYPTARNSITSDGKIKINTWSTFKSSEITFQLNTPFQETTADGREVTTTALLYGNKLVKDQKNTAHRSLDSIETREFTADGQFMPLIHTMPNNPKIRSVRVYKRKSE